MTRKPAGEKVVDTGIVPPAAWVSYVGCVGSVLQARGVRADRADVAGMSGYAFLVIVADRLCPSGPTGFDWMMLQPGTEALGIETEIVTIEYGGSAPAGKVDRALAAELFERVRQEVDEGRPCVLWGATDVPEFGIVYGYRDDGYLVRSYRSVAAAGGSGRGRALGPRDIPEEPVKLNALKAPGCLAGVFFGDRFEPARDRAERDALARAVQLLRGRHTCFSADTAHGPAAFEEWAKRLGKGDVDPLGNAYTAACWQEMQGCAAEFCTRLVPRHRPVAASLESAAAEFSSSAQKLGWLTEKFPFPQGGDLKDRTATGGAAERLRACAVHNDRAAAALEQALAQM